MWTLDRLVRTRLPAHLLRRSPARRGKLGKGDPAGERYERETGLLPSCLCCPIRRFGSRVLCVPCFSLRGLLQGALLPSSFIARHLCESDVREKRRIRMRQSTPALLRELPARCGRFDERVEGVFSRQTWHKIRRFRCILDEQPGGKSAKTEVL